nr:MAG TPA: hypothetical protein [Caudoviricetes sp.]
MKEMERTEFTPGPWQVREGSYCEVEDAQGKRIARTVLQREQGYGWHGGALRGAIDRGNKTRLANTRLIAAAPEMYGLLDMIQIFLEVSGDENTRIAFLTQIRKVLAKARGETGK